MSIQTTSVDPKPAFWLEVCVDRVDHAFLAVEAGANRIEMNSALAMSGLTPSIASCQWLAEELGAPTIAMLRPHDDGFTYSQSEQRCMLRDCEMLLETGIAGIAFGALTPEHCIDTELLRQIARICEKHELVFHRAFDALDDQLTGLDQLIENGVNRVLTSGGAPKAPEGIPALQRLYERAQNQIEILPGSGIHAGTAKKMLDSLPQCRQLHGSFRTERQRPDSPDISRTCRLMEQCFGP